MDNRNIIYFLFFLLILVTYFLHKESTDNNRLYKICKDQDLTIQLQSKAIEKQNLYIHIMHSSKNQKLEYSPIH